MRYIPAGNKHRGPAAAHAADLQNHKESLNVRTQL
jgi:hypothetical protein